MGSGSYGTGNIRMMIVPTATKFNTAVTQDTNIITNNLLITTATGTESHRFKTVATYTVEVCFDTAGAFTVVTYDDDVEKTGKINASTELEADEIFTFTKVMPETWDNSSIGTGDPITSHIAGLNFRFSTGATLNWMVTTIHPGIY